MRAALAALLLVLLITPAGGQVSSQADRAARDYGRYIESQYPVVDDPALVDRVGRIVERVRVAIGNSDYEWRFRVIANPVPNAFALPNGWIYIHQGLIENLPGATPMSDDEIAFVLAHEMSHVVLMHGTREATASTSLQRIVRRSGVVQSQAASVLSTLLRNGVEASFSREMESEADRWAVTWTGMAGYDPEAALALFERMREYQASHTAALRIFHTHPSASDRIRNVRKWIGTKPAPSGGTLDGAPVARFPITLVVTAPRDLATALAPPSATAAQGDATPAEVAPCPVLPVEQVAAHLRPLLDITNLVTLRTAAVDPDALRQAATERGADAIFVVVLEGVDKEVMPWPEGSVYSVCVRLTGLLVRTRDGAVLDRIPSSAARRATLSARGGLTRDDIFDEVLERALRQLDKPLAQSLRELRSTPPALAK